MSVLAQPKHGTANLNDPTVTLLLIKLNTVLGAQGVFNNHGTLNSVGLTCAICDSTVDNSIASSNGKRIDGLANRDLNIAAIAAGAPNLQPVINLLQIAPEGNDRDKTLIEYQVPVNFDSWLYRIQQRTMRALGQVAGCGFGYCPTQALPFYFVAEVSDENSRISV